MENEIKMCFCLYLNHIKLNVKNIQDLDVSSMTIDLIRSQLNIIHMQFILTSPSYSISETSPSFVAYNHLKKMIDGEDINMKCQKLESDIKLLNLENANLKQEFDNLKIKVSDALFQQSQSPTSIQTSTSTPNQQSKGWWTSAV